MKTEDYAITRRIFIGATGGMLAASTFGLNAFAARAEPVQAADVAALETALGRKVITPANGAQYDAARFIWNALFDRRPAIIAACHSAQDVAHCIRFVRAQGLALSIRSGGHHPAGFGMNDGGFVIDCSGMNKIEVEQKSRKVTVGPGARVADVLGATEPMGLVVPVAACPTVGVGGMTTGGGEGWFGEFGLSIDNLLSAEIVTADGHIRRIDPSNEPDLFWAIRGGGANFGVLTSLEFRAHPLPELMFGLQAYPLTVSTEVGMKWRAHCLAAAPDFTSYCTFTRKPGPALLLLSKTGRPAMEAKAEFEKLRAFGPSLQEMVKPVTSVELELMGAADTVAGRRNFAYFHYLHNLSPKVFELCSAAIAAAPSQDSAIFIQTLSAGVSKVPVDATPYPHRGQRFSLLVQSRWSDAETDQKNIQWVKDLWQALLPFATGEVYSNYVSDTQVGTPKRVYAGNCARLARIKRRYDPHNIFNSTINIKPA